MTSLEQLASAMYEVAAELLQGTVFDHIWAWHLQRDAQQLRLLAQAGRHRRGVDQPGAESDPPVVVQSLGLPVESPPVAAPQEAAC